MKRFPFNYRHLVYNEGPFYAALFGGRKPVVPGERVSSLRWQAKLISAVFEKANVSPLMAQAWAFYVPNRLVWDQWVDFIALDAAVTAAPKSTVAAPNFMEPSASAPGNVVFPRRAFKLIYNQYFGDEQSGQVESWYTNPLDDTDVTLRRLLAWDQYRASTKNNTGYTPLTYIAPVSGATATITLDDLQRSLDYSRATRRQKSAGDKYVDTMRLFGVELDWRVQNAPEFLGTSQVIIQPRERASSQAVDGSGANQLAKRAAEYAGVLNLSLNAPKVFAEHGYIIIVCGFRPAFMSGAVSPDLEMDTPQEFFRPELGNVVENVPGRLRERYFAYIKGSNYAGVNQNGNIFTNFSAWYPDPAVYVPITGSGPNHMAFGAEVGYRGVSPVRPNVA